MAQPAPAAVAIVAPPRVARAPRVWRPLLLAATSLAALALTYLAAAFWPAARMEDAVILHEFVSRDTPAIEAVSNFLLALVELPLFPVWGVALVLLALAQSRRRVAVAVT